uniref:Protein lifeguard 4 n=1 Tax=Hadrurus spadix TaxID=141984 RepID=A0A1W7RAA7_9SCOR
MADIPITIDIGSNSIVNDFMYGSNVAKSHIHIRMGFIRKVYGILTAQLFLTTIVAATSMFTPLVRFYINENEWMVLVAFLLSIILLLALMIKRRETPLNYILLTAFTAVEAYSVAVIVTFYDQLAVLQAFFLTFCVTVCLTIYSFQSKYDMSSWGASLFSMLFVLCIASILQMFIGSSQMEMLLSIAGAILFSIFIIYDTHMIMHRVSPEEYIMASIDLYLDIINLFVHLLRILGHSRKG